MASDTEIRRPTAVGLELRLPIEQAESLVRFLPRMRRLVASGVVTVADGDVDPLLAATDRLLARLEEWSEPWPT